MKDLYTLLFMLLLPSLSYAQDRIAYSYDAAGNRVKREIVMLNSKAMAKQQIFSQEEQSLSEVVNDKSIKISANATSGILTISIPNLKSTDRCSLKIYSAKGMLILNEDIRTSSLDFDLSNHPAGIYLLRVSVNNTPTTWKITKG